MPRRLPPARPAGGWAHFVRKATPAVFWALVDAFRRNNLLTYASGIAFQVLIAVVAMALLGFALLDVLGLQELWRRASDLPSRIASHGRSSASSRRRSTGSSQAAASGCSSSALSSRSGRYLEPFGRSWAR
jgi:uncharacterized BrkB/YihY/UPF0761 family membrane protein